MTQESSVLDKSDFDKWCDFYESHGIKLVLLRDQQKLPLHKGWNKPGAGYAPRDYVNERKGTDLTFNAGVHLVDSRMVCIDVDDEARFSQILENNSPIGMTYAELCAAGTVYRSGKKNRSKILFKIPDGYEPEDFLSSSWYHRDNPKSPCVEFHCITHNGNSLQDVLPPTIYSKLNEEGQFIRYHFENSERVDFQDCPEVFASAWRESSRSRQQLSKEKAQSSIGGVYGWIQAYDDYMLNQHTLEEILLATGEYTQVGYKFQHKNQNSGNPGIALFPDGRKGWSYSESDPLYNGRKSDVSAGMPFGPSDIALLITYRGDQNSFKQAALAIPEVKARLDAHNAPLIEEGKQTAKNLLESNIPIVRLSSMLDVEQGPEIPLELIYTDDDFGMYVKAIVDRTKRRNNPAAALAGGFANVSLASGGAIRGDDDETMDMIMLIVGDSTRGKTESMRAARAALPDALDGAYINSIASKAGIEDFLKAASTFPALLAGIDEMGFFFKVLNSKNIRDKNALEMRQLLMTMKGCTRYTTRPLANTPSTTVAYPLLTVLGATTVEALKGGLHKSDVEDGLGGRITCFNGDRYATRKEERIQPIPAWIHERLRIIQEKVVKRGDLSKAIRVKFSKEARDFMNKKDNEIFNTKGENHLLHTRKLQNAEGFAMSRALFNDPDDLHVSLQNIQLSYEISCRCVDYMVWLIEGCLSDTDEMAAIEQILRRLDKLGGDYHKGGLLLNCSRYKAMRGFERRSIRDEILLSETVEEYSILTVSGKSEKRWRLVRKPSWFN